MKFFCNGTELANATNVVSKALAVNKNIPILEGIKISAYGTTLVLSAYNQELFIEKTISADIQLEGELIVNGKIFNEYANKLANINNICIERIENDKLSIIFDGNETIIMAYSADNFPKIEQVNDAESFLIKECDFKDLIEKVIFCVATNDTRPVLKGCNMEIKGDKIEAVCMDGYRIALCNKPIVNENLEMKFVIMGKTLSDIAKILSDSDDMIKISKTKNMVIVDLRHTIIKTNTFGEDYYKFRQIIPKEINNEIIVNKDELVDCISRCSIISRELSYNKVTIFIEEDTMEICAESEKGNAKEFIKCKSVGEPIKIGLNSKFLMDAISRVREDYIKIEVEKPIKPIVVKQIDSAEYLSIILPLKLMG